MPTTEPAAPPTLATRAVRGALWSVLSQGVQVTVGILSFAVLAPWLSPDDFGKFGLSLMATGLLGVVGDSGVTAALVRRERLDDAALASGFWLSFAGAFVLAAIAAAAAPLIAWFFDDPALLYLALANGAVFPLSALGRVPTARLTKGLRFRALAGLGLASSLVGLTAGTLTASMGLGAWSLVWMSLSAAFALALGAFALAPTPVAPRLVTRALVRELGAFGSQVSAFSLALTLSRFLDGPLIGRYVSEGAIGLFTMATRLTLLPVQRLAGAVASVFLPTIVQVDRGAPRQRALARALGALNLGIIPFCVGVAAIAEEVVALLPPKWSGLAPALRCLALAAMFEPTGFLSISVATAEGHTRGLLRATLLLVPLNWCAALAGALTGDATVFFAAWAISNALGGLVLYQVAARALELPSAIPPGWSGPLLTSLVMGAAVRAILFLLGLESTRAGFVVGALSGVAIYAVLVLLFHRAAVADAVTLFKKSRR